MRTISVEEAVNRIPDGASLMVGGFMGVGTPERLMDEIVRQGKKDLTVIANAIFDAHLPAWRRLGYAGLQRAANALTPALMRIATA